VCFNNPQPFEQSVTTSRPWAPGLRVAYKANVSFRLDYGFIVQKGTPTNQDSGRPNFSLVWVF
jgi:hemolysin activation/secretion protein